MQAIANIKPFEILDSRGVPTVEVMVTLEDGTSARSAVPSGASTGTREALELRDKDNERYCGKGVLKACQNIERMAKALMGLNPGDQERIDQLMIELDGSDNKRRLGANAILAISMGVKKAFAKAKGLPLFKAFGETQYQLPVPMINIINGGAHASNGLDIQEFMIMPMGQIFSESIRMGSEVFHALKSYLSKNHFSTAVGDEGGFAPNFKQDRQAIEAILKAIEQTPYRAGEDIYLALDVASSEFYQDGQYHFQGQVCSATDMIDYLDALTKDFPIISIEDGLSEDDWAGWKVLTKRLGEKCQLVGDDLFVTNTHYLEKGIHEHIANAILLKLNQIGTVTETIEALKLAKAHGFNTIASHRSGETEDTFLADFAVGLAAGQIKTGSLSRSERVAKYNQLMRIEHMYELEYSPKKWFKYL